MFSDTRNVEVIAVCANTNHQPIVGDLILTARVQTAGALDHTSFHVKATGIGQVEMVLVSKTSIPAGEKVAS